MNVASEMDHRTQTLQTVENDGGVHDFLLVRHLLGFPVSTLKGRQPLAFYDAQIVESQAANRFRRYLLSIPIATCTLHQIIEALNDIVSERCKHLRILGKDVDELETLPNSLETQPPLPHARYIVKAMTVWEEAGSSDILDTNRFKHAWYPDSIGVFNKQANTLRMRSAKTQ